MYSNKIWKRCSRKISITHCIGNKRFVRSLSKYSKTRSLRLWDISQCMICLKILTGMSWTTMYRLRSECTPSSIAYSTNLVAKTCSRGTGSKHSNSLISWSSCGRKYTARAPSTYSSQSRQSLKFCACKTSRTNARRSLTRAWVWSQSFSKSL